MKFWHINFWQAFIMYIEQKMFCVRSSERQERTQKRALTIYQTKNWILGVVIVMWVSQVIFACFLLSSASGCGTVTANTGVQRTTLQKKNKPYFNFQQYHKRLELDKEFRVWDFGLVLSCVVCSYYRHVDYYYIALIYLHTLFLK